MGDHQVLVRKDTLGPFERVASGNAYAEDDQLMDGELIHRPSTALNLLGASIRDSSYPGEPAGGLCYCCSSIRCFLGAWHPACADLLAQQQHDDQTSYQHAKTHVLQHTGCCS